MSDRTRLLALLSVAGAGLVLLPLFATGTLPGTRLPSPPIFGLWVLLWLVLLLLTIPLVSVVRERPLSRATRWMTRVTLLCLTTVGTLLVLEGLLRAILPATLYEVVPDPGSPPVLYSPHPLLGRTLTPGFRGQAVHPEFPGIPVRINTDGFRDREWEETPDDDRTRLIGLGDSFVFGIGVEEEATFLRVIEAIEPVHTFNLGVPGGGPSTASLVLGERIAGLRPDLVCHVIYTGNDLHEEVFFSRRTSQLGRQTLYSGLRALQGRVIPRRAALALRERLGKTKDELRTLLVPRSTRREHISLLSRAYWERGSRLFAYGVPRLAGVLAPLGLLDVRSVEHDFVVRSFRDPGHASVREAIELLLGALVTSEETARRQGADYLVLLAPHQVGVRDDPELPDPGALHRLLVERLGDLDIPVIDLLPPLRAAAARGDRPFHREGHWNEIGHGVVAASVIDWIRSAPSETPR